MAETIQARVDARLLTKADRLFTGTIEGRMIELLQNARRAGARNVKISVTGQNVIVEDDGRGIDDFQKLLSLGASGWAETTEASEDPAGVGLFCLAPRAVVIDSNGKRVVISGSSWTGAPVEIVPSSVKAGTQICFAANEYECAAWASKDKLRPFARFTGMSVDAVDGRIEPEPFLTGDEIYAHPELGINVRVIAAGDWRTAELPFRSQTGDMCNCVVNFHGQIVGAHVHHYGFDLGPETTTGYFIDMNGTPTGLRLMLPARTRVVENPAFKQLQQVLLVDTFKHLQRRGTHGLPFKTWKRVKDEFGITLPEATPRYTVGLMSDGLYESAPAFEHPDPLPLDQCYRAKNDLKEGAARTVHLFACYADRSKLPNPFYPIDVLDWYAGYSWHDAVPTIESVTVERDELPLARDWVCGADLTCCPKLSVTIKTSDGLEFKAEVCASGDPADGDDFPLWVTPAAHDTLENRHAWYLLGGFNEDGGDSYDTQETQFEDAWRDFWLRLDGPDNLKRFEILHAIDLHCGPGWTKLTAHAATETVRVQFKNRPPLTLAPKTQKGGLNGQTP